MICYYGLRGMDSSISNIFQIELYYKLCYTIFDCVILSNEIMKNNNLAFK